MPELIPGYLVSQIIRLNLPARIIANNKAAFPIIIKNHIGNDSYKILLDSGKDKVEQYNKLFIELKGNIDIESLKYVGEVSLTSVSGEPGYYKMVIHKLYKVNERKYRRVPYHRAIKILTPVECQGILINISASGAMIQCPAQIQGNAFVMEIILAKRKLTLKCVIVEQFYNEEQKAYMVRCYFDGVASKTQKLIALVVKEITLRAKERLRSQDEPEKQEH